jgi:hypothetical protein
MKFSVKSVNLVFIILTGLTAWIFFGVLYKYHLLYIEGMQMFLFTGDYFTETCFQPGGFADYVSRFLTQFYHYPLLGGGIIALLFILLQQGTEKVTGLSSGKGGVTPLSFIPVFIYWSLMCNENYTLSGLTGLTAGIWSAWAYMKTGNKFVRAIYGLTALPILWYLFGGGIIVTVLLILYFEIISLKGKNLYAVITTIIVSGSLFFSAGIISPQLNTRALITGGHYFRFEDIPITTFYCIWGSVFAIVILARLLPLTGKKWAFSFFTILILLSGGYFINNRFMSLHEEVMNYYINTHNRQWYKVISNAEKKSPGSEVATNCLNLALGMTGQMGDRLFNFFQKGIEGLILDYKEDVLISGEILFNLGFINESQRYAYESMESIPDKQKGTLFITRLAETNLIAGRNRVAEKYLHTLRNTLFYRKWADERIALLKDSIALDKHPVYGNLRRVQPKENFIYRNNDFRYMLTLLLSQNPDNSLAFDYLMSALLLTKDLNTFAQTILQKEIKLPLYYQETLAFLIYARPSEYGNIKVNISKQVFDRLGKYIRLFNMMGNDASIMAKDYGNTYWFYLNFVQL